MSKNTKILMFSILSIALILSLYGYFRNKAGTNVSIVNTATPTVAPVIDLTPTKEIQPYYGQIELGISTDGGTSIGTSIIKSAPNIHKNTIPENMYFISESNQYFGLLFRANIDKSDFNNFRLIGYSIKSDKANYDVCVMEDNQRLEQENQDGNISKVYTNIYSRDKYFNHIQSLYKSGGKIEINSILTTVKDGKNEGGFDDNLNEWGKVYHTYDDMIKAREWNKPEQFKQFFNKDFYFKGERIGS